MEINKEEFKQLILDGKTIPELQNIYGYSRTKIADLKKQFGFVGLSPNSKKIDRELGEKACISCNKVLPLSSFYSNGKTTTGKVKYKPTCFTCENTSRKTTFAELIFDYLSTVNKHYECEFCKLSGPYGMLDFHHKNPSEKLFSVGNYNKTVSIHTFIKDVVPEIQKCILLCPNCHRKEHLLMGSK